MTLIFSALEQLTSYFKPSKDSRFPLDFQEVEKEFTFIVKEILQRITFASLTKDSQPLKDLVRSLYQSLTWFNLYNDLTS